MANFAHFVPYFFKEFVKKEVKAYTSQRVLLKRKYLTVLTLTSLLASSASFAQTSTYAVSGVYTDYGGFWQSSSSKISTIKPDNSHDLLAFTFKGITYSTGVNDALLKTNQVSYVAGQYKSLAVTITGTTTVNTKIGVGEKYDGVSNGGNTSKVSNNMSSYLIDGTNGLNLGTGVANVPAGTLSFSAEQIIEENVGDGVPDILVTQIAQPDASKPDTYAFYDANNQPIGSSVQIIFSETGIPLLGNWIADFYEVNGTFRLESSFTKTERALRLWAADFSAFNISQADVARIHHFQITLSGSSDLAFVALNTATPVPLPVSLVDFKAQAFGREVQLSWQTASEIQNEKFEVQASSDGKNFKVIGTVPGYGNSSVVRNYQYVDAQPAAGTMYYRLKQIDFDGKYEYSKIVAVQVKGTVSGNLYPNPTPDAFTLTHDLATGQERLQVMDMNGRLVLEKAVASATSFTKVDTGKLPSGMYQVIWMSGTERKITKLIKQ